MTKVVFVKPADGARIRMPDRNSNVMPAEGMLVPRNVYYERMIVTGELIVDDDQTSQFELDERARKEKSGEPASPPPAPRKK